MDLNLISDQGIKSLAEHGDKFFDLQEIYFAGNKLTDAALTAIALKSNKFPKLKVIHFD